MKKLEDYRKEIDKIDERLLKLINKRAAIGVKIAEVKAKTGSPVFLPARERQILKKIAANNQGPLSAEAACNVFREIFSATRSVEKAMRISCLGPAGSFSHLATLRLFGASVESAFQGGIDMVFDDVEKGVADMGVVPIENSIEGAVGQTLDRFVTSPLKIFGETYLDIHLSLLSLAKKVKDVKTLYTHYMPLGQCRAWVGRNLPGVNIIETSSSAEASIRAREDKTAAALGAPEAAKIYGLGSLAERIEERQDNQTRFLVISRTESPKSGADKTSIIFSTRDEAGALYKILRPFADRGLNLTKIQSRPNPERNWEYVFFVDFDGHMESPEAKKALEKIRPRTVFLKVLGSYPSGR